MQVETLGRTPTGAKKALRIEVMANTIINWTGGNWKTSNSLDTNDTGLDIYVGDIFQKDVCDGKKAFTFLWKKSNRWEVKDFVVSISK